MDIRTLEIAGFNSALMALRLPYKKECRSTVNNIIDTDYNSIHTSSMTLFYDKDIELLMTLVLRGDEHAKVLRGINVWAEITAPIYFWWDLETYTVGHTRLMSESTMNDQCRGLTGEELQKVKGEIPFGHEVKKIDMFSYQTLRRIYFQRKDHRLPEFRQFREWIETLPFANSLITITKKNS